ncbi:MAG: hypothetical protein IJD75_01765 [Clostridia bacterium]|nr:hypothetical protein [Clostridia bacterium]
MSLFQKQQNLSPRAQLENNYRISRANLLAVVAFTLLNVILALFGGDVYLLFSASVPYYLVINAMALCGKLPAEYYDFENYIYDFWGTEFLFAMTAIAIVIIALFALFWLLSKRNMAFLIASLVLFGLDTVGMFVLFGFSSDMILDIVFHAWVIYYLILGIVAGVKLKNLPPEEAEVVIEPSFDSDLV